MYSTYTARQAIFDRKNNVIGYELLFRDSEENQFPVIDPDIATSKLIIQNHLHDDITALCLGKPAYINFNEQCLINKFPLMFDKNSVVIELIGHQSTSKRLLKILQFYHEKGYKIALTEYDLDSKWDVLFPYISMIKLDMSVTNAKRVFPLLAKVKEHNIQLVAEKVETRYQLQSLAEVGFNYYQGFFYHEPEIIKGQTLAPIKTQMLSLMSETFNTPINFDAIAEIISHDVNLSVGLLKMVNNVSTGVRVEIKSLKQAAAYLGEDKLKQFVSILALSQLTSEKNEEAAKQALITAKLMTAIASGQSVFKSITDLAFITGLLSSIDVILGMPIEEVVTRLPMDETINKALVEHAGILGELLTLCSDYIVGNGKNLKQMMETYDISADFIQKEFVNASNWCKSLNI
ncbi:EAL and HDOD domain-containing protein [Thalassotalea agariperforans]